MSFLATRLDGRLSIGEALTRAKQDYYLTAGGMLSSYDRKALLEATMFGLPFYGVGVAPTAIPGSPAGVPVAGATNVTTPFDGTLVNDPVSGQPSAEFSLTPTFTLVNGPKGTHYSNAGQVTSVNYRPIVPRVSLPATRAGQIAHYPFVESLESAPDEPELQRSLLDADDRPRVAVAGDGVRGRVVPEQADDARHHEGRRGQVSQLNISTGQFFPNPANPNRSIGTMRRFTKVTGRVYYNAGNDFTNTAIENVQATRFGSNVGFVVNVPDVVARARAVPRREPACQRVDQVEGRGARAGCGEPLTLDGRLADRRQRTSSGSCRGSPRTATSPRARTRRATSTRGGSERNNGIQIDLTRRSPAGTSRTSAAPVTVTATGPAGVALSRRLDDGDEADYTDPFVVGDGPNGRVHHRRVHRPRRPDGSTVVRDRHDEPARPDDLGAAAAGPADVHLRPGRDRRLPLPRLGLGNRDVRRHRDAAAGTVPSGHPLPTNAVGIKTLSVTGRTSSATPGRPRRVSTRSSGPSTASSRRSTTRPF